MADVLNQLRVPTPDRARSSWMAKLEMVINWRLPQLKERHSCRLRQFSAKAILLASLAVCSLSMPTLRSNDPASPQKAIVVAVVTTEKEVAAKADALIVSLANCPAVTLVERTRLDLLLKEKALQFQNVSERKEIGGILSADALVVLSTLRQKKMATTIARVVDASSGMIVGCVAKPESEADAVAWSGQVAEFLSPMLIKTARTGAPLFPVSLLGVRATVNTVGVKPVENELTALLAHRLMSRRDVIVLDRWAMRSLMTEKELGGGDTPFATGRVIVDGTLRLGPEKRLSVSLRAVDASGNELTAIEQDGTIDNLAELAERLADRVCGKLDTAAVISNFSAAAEAAQYLGEARWALAAGHCAAARDAADAAWALGLRSPDLSFLRVKSYCGDLLPKLGVTVNVIGARGTDRQTDFASLVVPMTDALSIYRDFVAAGPKNATMWDDGNFQNDWAALGFFTLRAASRTLEGVKESGVPPAGDLSERLADLRSAARDAYHAAAAKGTRGNDLPSLQMAALHYGAYWSETPGDAIALYRQALDRRQPFARRIRDIATSRRAEPGDALPWLVGWRGETKKELDAIWMEFISSLTNSTVAADKADGLLLAFLTPDYPVPRQQLLAEAMALVEAEKASLADDDPNRSTDIIMRYVAGNDSLRNGDATVFAYRMILFILGNHHGRPNMGLLSDLFAFGGKFTRGQLAEISTAAAKTRDELAVRSPATPSGLEQTNAFAYKVAAALRKLEPSAQAGADALLVTDSIGIPKEVCPEGKMKMLYLRRDSVCGGKLWLQLGDNRGDTAHALMSIEEAGSKVETVAIPKKGSGGSDSPLNCFDVTDEGIYLMFQDGVIARRGVNGGAWAKIALLEAPPRPDSCFMSVSSDRITLSYGYRFQNPDNSSGMAVFDRRTGAWDLIASNRRRPSQSPLDDRKPSNVKLFTTPDGSAVVSSESSVHLYSPESRKWGTLITFERGLAARTQRCRDGVLAIGDWGEVFHIPAKTRSPEALLLTGASYAGKEWTPSWTTKRAEYSWMNPSPYLLSDGLWRYAFDDGDLYVAGKVKPDEAVKLGDPYYLRLFRKGNTRAEIVPLAFDGIADRSTLYTDRGPLMFHMLELGGTLVFVVHEQDRIWRLPKSKVKSFIDSHPER